MVFSLLLILSFLWCALGTFLATSRVLGLKQNATLSPTQLLALSVGLGPALLSASVFFSLLIFPGRSDFFYVVGNVVLFGLFAGYGRNQRDVLVVALKTIPSKIRLALDTSTSLLALTLLTLAGLILFRALSTPFFENDPVDYLNMAKLVYAQKTFAHYPFIHPETNQGFYNVTSHPPAYVSLLIWGFFIQGGDTSLWLAKWVSPYFVLTTILLVGFLLQGLTLRARLLAAVLLVSCPIYAATAGAREIDAFRIYLFLLPFVLAPYLLGDFSLKRVLLFGVLWGLSLYSHGSGILSLALIPLMLFLLPQLTVRQKWQSCLFGGSVAVLLGGYQYFKNVALFGSPISYELPAMSHPKVNLPALMREVLNVATPFGRLWNGVLGCFTWTDSFGYLFFLSALAWVATRKDWRRYPQLRITLAISLAFFCLDLIATMRGSDAFIMNRRYLTMLVPFAVYPITVLFEKAMAWAQTNLTFRGARAFCSLGVAALCVVVSVPVYATTQEIWGVFVGSRSNLSLSDWEKLQRYCTGQVLHFIKENTEPQSTILSSHYNEDLLYTGRKVVRMLDSRLMPIFDLTEPRETFEALHRLGINYIHTTNFWPHRLPRTSITPLLHDTRYTQLLFGVEGMNVYRLREKPVAPLKVSQYPLPDPDWATQKVNPNLPTAAGGSAELPGWDFSSTLGMRWEPEPSGETRLWMVNPKNETRPILRTQRPDWRCLKEHRLEPNQEYFAEAELKGTGVINLLVLELIPQGGPIRHSLAGVVLNRDWRKETIHFRTGPQACDFSFSVASVNAGEVTLRNLSLTKVSSGPESVASTITGERG